jgi:hypothetical protein
MRKLMLAMGCAAMVVPATMVVPVSQAGAQRYKYREWRDNRGRLRCRKPDGTTLFRRPAGPRDRAQRWQPSLPLSFG